MWNEVPKSGELARSLNSASDQTVPWAVENTPLPESDAHAAHRAHAGHDRAAATDTPSIPLQQVVDTARERGVVPGYGITLPTTPTGVFSIAVFADDPRNDATLHLDRYSGKVLADALAGLRARRPERGDRRDAEGRLFGLANQLLMFAVCLMILLSAVSGLVLWWKRRPSGRLGVPPLPHGLPLWRGAVVIMLVLGVAFPLVGLSLVLVWALDRLVLSRFGGGVMAG